jgi:hypothetical protein
MPGMNRNVPIRLLALCLLAVFATACVSDPRSSYSDSAHLAIEDIGPVGGEALSQRKIELQRSLRDMRSFRDTIVSMQDRDDDRGVENFRYFMDRYMATHLDPLLKPVWQSSHPELILVDANLRFIQAEVLIELGYRSWSGDAIDQITHRYDGRGNMLIDYPTGTQTTLREALTVLRTREFREI